VDEHSDPTSEEGHDCLLAEDSSCRVARGCLAVVGRGLGAVDMVDQRTSKEGSAAIAAGLGCWAEEAWAQAAIHPSGAGEHRGDCSDPG
jgi:hypothetical protein